MIEKPNASTPQSEPQYIRLHITPLNPTLLLSIVAPVVLPFARNISYHSIQAFPEKDFGFMDLPRMEAEKIRKKFNGAILKGTKVRIEDARPSREGSRANGEATTEEMNTGEGEKPSKKRKRDPQTLPAVELQGRKVKRGWTDPMAPKKSDKRGKDKKEKKGKKDVMKSKYTSDPECLFRTTLPANRASSLKEVATAADLKAVPKNRKSKGKDIVVHEFSKTIKHASFLRSSGVPSTAKGVSEYVKEKGWVDQYGNVVDAPNAKYKKAEKSAVIKEASSTSSSDVSDSSGLEDLSEDDGSAAESITKELHNKLAKAAKAAEATLEDSSTSSSEISSDEQDNEDTSSDETSSLESAELESSKEGEAASNSRPPRLPTTPLKINIPKPTETSEGATTVHPLEALFKRRRPDSLAPIIADEPKVPSFSFFGAEGEEDEGEDEGGVAVMEHVTMPMTPFTQQDFALRGQRSAAPTPDTAFPNKSFQAWPMSQPQDQLLKHKRFDGDGDEQDANSTPTKGTRGGKGLAEGGGKEETDPSTDFQRWFYEHRGETNRAWKKRRKAAAKEKRQRENRKRSGVERG